MAITLLSIATFFHLQPPLLGLAASTPPAMELPVVKIPSRPAQLAHLAGTQAAHHQFPASLRLGPAVAACARPLAARAALALLPAAAAASSKSSGAEGQSDESNALISLDSIRRSLIKQEDTIVFSLIERSQFCYNPNTYDRNASGIVGFKGSLVEFMVQETEKCHALMGRYKSPDEHPFFPEPLLPSVQYKNVLHPAAASININKKIWSVYFDDVLPRLVNEGSDGNCGSSAFCDTIILQALSKRIHYGKFVAEAKFQESPAKYKPAIKAQDKNKLMEMLTDVKVEENVKRRVKSKAMTFGQVVSSDASPTVDTPLKIEPELAAELYDRWIMPLTKEVQVQYLLRRLD